ncbi:MAG: hypothetical protein ACOCVF_00410 [bacterium]
MKIKKLNEIVNQDGELIGSEQTPEHGANLDSDAKNTTDYNLQIGHQPYRYDTLARFGFLGMPFYEGVDDKSKIYDFINESYGVLTEYFKKMLGEFYKNPNKTKAEYRKYKESNFDELSENRKKDVYETITKIYELVDKYQEKDENVNESKLVNGVVEDLVKHANNGICNEKEDVELLDKEIKRVAELINKLDHEERKKLRTLIEIN